MIYDIGCCVGHWIAANYEEGKKFVGVEALRSSYEKAVERFVNNPDVLILNLVVCSDPAGKKDFYRGRSSIGEVSSASEKWITQSRHAKNETWEGPVSVACINLDRLIDLFGPADYIKIDVEGLELDVIRGLSTKQGGISFEWLSEFIDDAKSSIEHLSDLGYKGFALHGGDNYTYVPDKYMTAENMLVYLDEFKNTSAWGMIHCK